MSFLQWSTGDPVYGLRCSIPHLIVQTLKGHNMPGHDFYGNNPSVVKSVQRQRLYADVFFMGIQRVLLEELAEYKFARLVFLIELLAG